MRAAVTLAALVLLAAGCADDEPSREEFAAEANAVCERHQARVGELRRPGVLELFEDYFDDVLPVVRAQRDELAALEPPADGRAPRDELLARWDEIVEILEDGREGARAGSDLAIVLTLRRAATAEREADAAARELGLEACRGFNPFTPR